MPPSASSLRRAGDGLHGTLGTPPVPVWFVHGTSSADPLGALIPFDDHLPQRLAGALCLWYALHGRAMPEHGPSSHRRSRLVLGLRALDGRDAGASYRDLAAGLFGAARVPTGAAWKTHDLRSRTMRLVADAIRLRDGGYLALLCDGPRVKLTR